MQGSRDLDFDLELEISEEPIHICVLYLHAKFYKH